MDYILSNIDDYKVANEEYDLKLNIWKNEIESRNNKIKLKHTFDEFHKFSGTLLKRPVNK